LKQKRRKNLKKMDKESFTYLKAGVNIEKGEDLVEWIKKEVSSHFPKRTFSEIGASANIYSLANEDYKRPLLVATTDGVGTKIKIAQEANRHRTVGIDLVAMCINDLLTQRAKPLFFLDYLATGKLCLNTAKEIISGIIKGCREANCILLGGETAEMPSFYEEGKYDLAGFAVGIVEEEKINTIPEIISGDKIIGIPSSGLHSNGFSLARKVLFEEKKFFLKDKLKIIGRSLEEELLEPTRIYTSIILNLLNEFNLKGIAHITGGGMIRNISRILPSGYRAKIYKEKWKVPPIFKLIQEQGKIKEEEMFKVFNMGIGMILIVSDKEKDSVLKTLLTLKEKAKIIGEIVEGKKGVEIS